MKQPAQGAARRPQPADTRRSHLGAGRQGRRRPHHRGAARSRTATTSRSTATAWSGRGVRWRRACGRSTPAPRCRSCRRSYHYCPTIFADAVMGVNGLSLVKPANVKKGDWVLFDWGRRQHRRPRRHLRGVDQEGLDLPYPRGQHELRGQRGSQSDGGGAFERTRSINDVARNRRGDYGFVHLGHNEWLLPPTARRGSVQFAAAIIGTVLVSSSAPSSRSASRRLTPLPG